MGAMASQIISLTIVYSTVYSGADQRKHQSSSSLAFMRGIHRWPVNSQHKWPVTWKMFLFDDVLMNPLQSVYITTTKQSTTKQYAYIIRFIVQAVHYLHLATKIIWHLVKRDVLNVSIQQHNKIITFFMSSLYNSLPSECQQVGCWMGTPGSV